MRDVHGDAVPHLHRDDLRPGLGALLRQAQAAAARAGGEAGRWRRRQDLHQPARLQDSRQHHRLLHRPVRGGGQKVERISRPSNIVIMNLSELSIVYHLLDYFKKVKSLWFTIVLAVIKFFSCHSLFIRVAFRFEGPGIIAKLAMKI